MHGERVADLLGQGDFLVVICLRIDQVLIGGKQLPDLFVIGS
jgi:hypothetical protein